MQLAAVAFAVLICGCSPAAVTTTTPSSTEVPAVSTAGTGSAAPASPQDWRLTPEGFGPVRVGMTVDEASAALGMPLKREIDYDPNGCGYVLV